MRKSLIIIALTILTLVFSISLSTKVSAGASKNYIVNESSVKNGSINAGDFINTNVGAKGNSLVFDGAGNVKTTGYITNMKDYGLKEVVNGSIDINVKDLGLDSMFSIMFGVASLRGDGKKAGTIEMRFTSIGDSLFLEVLSYNPDGQIKSTVERIVLSGIKFYDLYTVEFSYSTSRDLSLCVREGEEVAYEIENKRIPMISGDGYFMMDLTGTGKVETTNMSVCCYNYEITENVDYLETFDNGMYNTNVFYSNSLLSPLFPSHLQVVKDGNNGYLEFMNTAAAHITTLYEYSNFEISFDLLDLARKVRYNEDGTVKQYISQWFGIAFGVDSPRNPVDIGGCNWFQFDGMKDYISSAYPDDVPRYIAWANRQPQKIMGQKDSSLYLYDPKLEGKVVSIKASVIDGYFKIYMAEKMGNETPEFNEPVFEYDYGTTKTGYVRIMTWGDSNIDSKGIEYNGFGNFTIDNLSIRNLDFEGIRKTVTPKEEYKVIGITPDFNYVDPGKKEDLLSDKIKDGSYSFNTAADKKEGCKSSVSLSIIAVPAVIGIISLKHKKEEE